ncbi:MAG: hypothetical protein ACRDYX_05890 [Egibacteraceae bacterium]
MRRKGRGRGFEYFDSRSGEKILDPDTLQRIRDLVLPPAWTDVWICPYPNGHLQAVGVDAAGRQQYRYHDVWRERRDAEKFDRMLDFAAQLPRLRKICAELLGRKELDRERVLACAVRLLDHGFFRIGTEEYDTFGLATIRKEHVTLRDGTVTFDYPSKGGKQRLVAVVDPAVAEVVGMLERRRSGGPELLAYREGRRWATLRTCLRSISGVGSRRVPLAKSRLGRSLFPGRDPTPCQLITACFCYI